MSLWTIENHMAIGAPEPELLECDILLEAYECPLCGDLYDIEGNEIEYCNRHEYFTTEKICTICLNSPDN